MSKTKSFLIALIIVVGLIFLNLPTISKEIKNLFYSASNLIQKNIDKFIKQTKSSIDFLKNLKNISQENIRLGEEIKELLAQNTRLKELGIENEFLRSYLKLPAASQYQIELANVIGGDFQGMEKYILVDKGNSSNIEKNMPVVVFENILVGKVIEVFNNFSKILLINSANSKIPALIQESRVEGLIIEGTPKNILFLGLIPKDIEVEKDQTVITSGMEGNFPEGLLIGWVLEVESPENEIFQKIVVKPAVEMERLEKVFIITNEGKIKN